MVAFSFFTDFFNDNFFEVEVESRLCLRNRLNSCRCRLCIEECPTGALTYAGNSIQLDQKKCTGCMLCTSSCPNDALTPGYDLGSELISLERSRTDIVTFSCPRHKNFSEGESVVPCLGVFSYESLLFLGSSPNKKTVYFNAVSCSSCTNATASLSFQKMLDSLRRLSGSSLRTDLIMLDGSEDGCGAADRRSFLAALKKSALSTAKSSLAARPRLDKDSRDTRRVPLKAKLRQKGADSLASGSSKLAAALTPDLKVSDGCVPCPRCSGICPAGALKLQGPAGSKKLIFSAEKCSGCGLCLNFCKHGALSLSSPYHPSAASRQ